MRFHPIAAVAVAAATVAVVGVFTALSVSSTAGAGNPQGATNSTLMARSVTSTPTRSTLADASGGESSGLNSTGARAQLGEALIRLSDLPAGWRTAPEPAAASSTVVSATAQQLATCVGISPRTPQPGSVAMVASPTFIAPDTATTVSGSARAYPSAATASDDLAPWGTARSADCVARIYGAVLKKQLVGRLTTGQALGEISGQRRPLIYGIDDEIAIPITSGTETINFYLDLIGFTRGPVSVRIVVTRLSSAIPQSFADGLVRLIYARTK